MYYYIFDPPTGAKEYERVAQIKDALAALGIAGEIAQPQPGRTIEDLVNNAISKRYSTIVAVGGMELINRVARAVEQYDIVLGIIPTVNHPDIEALIGTVDWKVAAEQLKRRRWQHVRLGMMNGEVCFLTPARIEVPSDVAFLIEGPSFTLTGMGGAISVLPAIEEEGELTIEIEEAPKSKRGFLSKLLSKQAEAPTASRFTVANAAIATASPIPVTVAGTPLISTPVDCTAEGKRLRLIVARGAS